MTVKEYEKTTTKEDFIFDRLMDGTYTTYQICELAQTNVETFRSLKSRLRLRGYTFSCNAEGIWTGKPNDVLSPVKGSDMPPAARKNREYRIEALKRRRDKKTTQRRLLDLEIDGIDNTLANYGVVITSPLGE